jgi:hypothetical protein
MVNDSPDSLNRPVSYPFKITAATAVENLVKKMRADSE